MGDKTLKWQALKKGDSSQLPGVGRAATETRQLHSASTRSLLPQLLRRAQTNIKALAPAEIRILHRTIGNVAAARLIAQSKQRHKRIAIGPGRSGGLIRRAWSDADPGSYPAVPTPGQLPTPTGGWNASTQTVGTTERIPIEGLKQGLQTEVDGTSKATKEGEAGKAIAVVPTTLKPNQAVEIFLHLHGHNLGYRERAEKSSVKGMAQGTVRDVATDRIEQQIGASGRKMIGILPQGTEMSGFGKFDPEAYINEVWGVLTSMKKVPQGAARGSVVLSGHSGAAAPIVAMLASDKLPAGLGELVLFDAIHGGQLGPVEKFLQARMAADVKAVRDLADPSKNGGLDAAALLTQQKAYLAGSFRFRGIFTPKFHPQKKENGKLLWQDPETKKKPVIDTTRWEGYGVQYEPLRDFIEAWLDGHTKGVDPALVAMLRENYKVVPAGPGATHNTIMGTNDNLQNALSVLPGAPTPTPSAPKTGEVEPASREDSATEIASTESAAQAPTEETAVQDETAVQAKREDVEPESGSTAMRLEIANLPQSSRSGGRGSIGGQLALQLQPSPPHPVTDAEQWENDWNTHTAQQRHFAGAGRPSGTPRERYNVLCPLYKAHGIPRPMVYFASEITTARFYGFSTPAHTNMATALAAAENTLKSQGFTDAPVISVWALNARTTSTGAWSNHADGKAVDLDPDTNPHLTDKSKRKIITEVTGTDMEKGSQGYDVMKGASEKFRDDYNPAGLRRRIAELKAVEDAKKAERDAAKTRRDELNRQRDTLKSERTALQKELKAVPKGRKATADDVAKAAELKTGIQEKETRLRQIEADIKSAETELKQREKDLMQATKDRDLLERELRKYEATEKAISDLESAVGVLPGEIKALDDQIAQSKTDEADARNAKDAAGVKAQQQLRSRLQQAFAQKKAELKKKEKDLEKKKKARDADPLRQYAAGGFLNLSKDVVDAMTGAGLKWGGNWTGAKDFMHFEL